MNRAAPFAVLSRRSFPMPVFQVPRDLLLAGESCANRSACYLHACTRMALLPQNAGPGPVVCRKVAKDIGVDRSLDRNLRECREECLRAASIPDCSERGPGAAREWKLIPPLPRWAVSPAEITFLLRWELPRLPMELSFRKVFEQLP